MSNKPSKTCPICTKDYGEINKSFTVCVKHLDRWIITRCEQCDSPVFSLYPGECIYHHALNEKLKEEDINV